MTAAELAEKVQREQQARLEHAKRPQAWAGWRASGLGDECERRIFLWRTRGDEAAPPSDDLAALFATGNMLHPVLRRLLGEMGIEVTAAETSFPKNDYGITGTVDGMVGDVVLEVKTINGQDFDRLNTAADFKASERFTRKWYAQVQVYMFLADKQEALIVLYDKWGGRLKAIPVPFDAEEAEALTDLASRLNAALASGEPPLFHADPSVCRRCPFFGRACAPPLDMGPGATILTDETIIQRLERRQELKAARDEFEGLDKKVKDSLKGIEQGIAGEFLIQGKAGKRKAFSVPESDTWSVKIVPLSSGDPSTDE